MGGILGAVVFHAVVASTRRGLGYQLGQFLLEALPNGHTRLTGTTWYENSFWPGAYWNVWSDYIIHRIHGRVLAHIKRETETTEETMK